MSNAYQRVKKFRMLKKLKIDNQQQQIDKCENVINEHVTCVVNNCDNNINPQVGCSNWDNSFVNNDININISSNESDNSDSDSSERVVIDNDVNSNVSFQEKLRRWAVKNINSLQLNVISKLLVLLKDEGHPTLPKIAQSLLQTNHHKVNQSILSLK